jgi:hypothetical protein
MIVMKCVSIPSALIPSKQSSITWPMQWTLSAPLIGVVMFRLTRIYHPLLIGEIRLVLDVTGNPFQKWVEGSRRFWE